VVAKINADFERPFERCGASRKGVMYIVFVNGVKYIIQADLGGVW